MKMKIAVIHYRSRERKRIMRQISSLNEKGIKAKEHPQVLAIEEEDKKLVRGYLKEEICEEKWQKLKKSKPVLDYYYRLTRYHEASDEWDNFDWDNIEEYFMDLCDTDMVILHDSNNFAREFYKSRIEGKKIVTIIVSNAVPSMKGYGVTNSEYREYICGCRLEDQFHLKEFLEDWWENGKENEKIFGKGIYWDFDILQRGKNTAAEDILGSLNILGMQLTKYINLLELDDDTPHPPLEDIPLRLRKDRLFRPFTVRIEKQNRLLDDASGPSEAGWYWFDYCLRDVKERSFDDLALENPELKKCPNIKKLWRILRGECAAKSDGLRLSDVCREWTQEKFSQFFENAHKEYQQLCDKSLYIKKIDDFRTYLNHTRLMNGFLYSIGNDRPDLSPEERYCDMLYAWKYLKKGEKEVLVTERKKVVKLKLKPKSIRIQKGLSRWGEIELLLERFFNDLPGECNFEVTREFEVVKQEALEWRKIIGKTVRQYNTADELPGDEKEMRKQLEEFLKAVHNLHTALSKMKVSKRFDTFFNYIIRA